MSRATTLTAAVVALLMLVSAPSWGHNTAGTDITVSPSANLVNDQAVNVSGSGFGNAAPIEIEQCAANESSCIVLGTTASNSVGSFSNKTVTVKMTFTGDNGPVDCAVSGCIIHAADNTIVPVRHATEAIAFVSSGPGDDANPPAELTCGGFRPTIVGTEDANVLVGTEGSDVIAGLGGDDIVFGLGGDDVVCGGEDDDTLKGGRGRDILYGQEGGDTLNGGAQKDRCVGDTGIDRAKKCERIRSL